MGRNYRMPPAKLIYAENNANPKPHLLLQLFFPLSRFQDLRLKFRNGVGFVIGDGLLHPIRDLGHAAVDPWGAGVAALLAAEGDYTEEDPVSYCWTPGVMLES